MWGTSCSHVGYFQAAMIADSQHCGTCSFGYWQRGRGSCWCMGGRPARCTEREGSLDGTQKGTCHAFWARLLYGLAAHGLQKVGRGHRKMKVLWSCQSLTPVGGRGAVNRRFGWDCQLPTSAGLQFSRELSSSSAGAVSHPPTLWVCGQ